MTPPTAGERPWTLRLGRWQDVLADVEMVDAVITDPPYGTRTHEGHSRALRRDDAGNLVVLPDGASRSDLEYASWGPSDVAEFVEFWSPRCRGWFVALTSHDLWGAYESALQRQGRYVFHPLPCVIRGMTMRIAGDGPSSWAVWAVVSRPRTKEWVSWGTLPGAYVTSRGEQSTHGAFAGGKPLQLMRAIVRDYTRPGDLVCDPCAGMATTLRAAELEGRRSIGAEMDPVTYAKARKRLEAGYTPAFDFGEEVAR